MGIRLRWTWVENFWIRLAHLLAILIVIVKPLTGRICPLTTWENQLRNTAGKQTNTDGFIQHWLHQLIYYDFPLWVFSICYIIFALLILLTWFFHPPKWPHFLRSTDSKS
jgi:hypothetical protein